MRDNKTKVLVFTPYYLPGFKAGGPIRSLKNLVDTLSEYFQFYIVTADREFRTNELYQGIEVNRWNQVGNARVFYCSPDKKSFAFFKKLIRETPHDILYLNSFFESYFTIIPLLLRRLHRIPQRQTILAPRGELSPGALAIKSKKKKIYINLAKNIKLYRGVVWHASNTYEEGHIRKIFGENVKIRRADNISSYFAKKNTSAGFKKEGFLNMVFLSRISFKKNLDGALRILRNVSGNIHYDIYGPIEDPIYWDCCKKIISTLPSNVKVNYRGIVPFDKVGQVLSRYHLFFFPSKAENYGHVIIEALSAGCPVLISDQTPWRELEKERAGYVVSLEEEHKFSSIIDELATLGNEQYSQYVTGARSYVDKFQNQSDAISKYKMLFEYNV